MRTLFSIVLAAAIIFVVVPAHAGNLTFSNGQASWQSTQCTAPTEPSSLQGVDPETHADRMNVYMTQYNQYVQQVQAYMDCIGNEAQKDADTASKAITGSAQATIENEQKNLSSLGSSLQRR